jgi:nicotinate-nucleotide--dimethylbenzimidazole phosphoribosyltransferase
MSNFTSFSALRALCLDLPSGHPAASVAVSQRETMLTKPPRSLGRLEELVAWLAHWQGHAPPRLQKVEVLVFAGNHGITGRGVSA